MVCVSKTLLCVLGLVDSGLAVRQNLAVERKSKVTSVVGIVGALLQARNSKNVATSAALMDSLRASARSFATPGAIDALNDALTTVISDLEANVETKIKAGFSDTQASIETHISDLTTATSAAVAQKGVADASDATWFSCVGDEKSKLEAVEAAEAALAAAQAALAAANAAYNEQKETCLENHETRQLAICQFGTDLQQKCSDVFAYNSLMAEVDQINGGVHSQPDRESEWQTTQVTKCMLGEIIAGHDISDTILTTCEDNVNFGTQVGVLDRKQSDFAAQTTADKFTCAEETITFNDGTTWETPTGQDPHSSDYVVVPFAPQVDVLTPPAFSFCTGN